MRICQCVFINRWISFATAGRHPLVGGPSNETDGVSQVNCERAPFRKPPDTPCSPRTFNFYPTIYQYSCSTVNSVILAWRDWPSLWLNKISGCENRKPQRICCSTSGEKTAVFALQNLPADSRHLHVMIDKTCYYFPTIHTVHLDGQQ